MAEFLFLQVNKTPRMGRWPHSVSSRAYKPSKTTSCEVTSASLFNGFPFSVMKVESTEQSVLKIMGTQYLNCKEPEDNACTVIDSPECTYLLVYKWFFHRHPVRIYSIICHGLLYHALYYIFRNFFIYKQKFDYIFKINQARPISLYVAQVELLYR